MKEKGDALIMRKQTKIAAVFSAAALLAVGAAMTSFAATGWQEENGSWVYYNKYGEKVTQQWAKSGDKWFYLDDNGNMLTDAIVDDNGSLFYVDANGVMVTNRWVEVDNSNDDSEDAPPTVWYYFQNNGKAYKANSESSKTSFKTINGKKYAFDADGRMLFGWVNESSERVTDDEGWKEADYYLGQPDDGAQQHNAWGLIHVVDNEEDEPDQDYWFYFGSNGKKYKRGENTTGIYEKTINGKKYSFNESGKMLSEWVTSETGLVATKASAGQTGKFKNFRSKEDGARYTKAWFRVTPSKYLNEEDSDDGDGVVHWYYADGKGGLYHNAIKSINGKKYAFNEQGEMIGGLVYLTFNGNDIASVEELDDTTKVDRYTKIGAVRGTGKDGVYYFGEEDKDGSLKSGNVNVTVDGEAYQFKFISSGGNKGKGLDGKKDKGYFINGRKIKADSDDKYKAYVIGAGDRVEEELNSTYLVDESVKVYKNGELKTTGSKDHLAPAYQNMNIVVVTTSGALASGTKKDGNDINLVIKGQKLVGAYRNE